MFNVIDQTYKLRVNTSDSSLKLQSELSLYSWMLSCLDYQNVWFDPVLVSLIELDSENKANYQKHLNEIDKLEFEYDTK